MTDQRSAGGRVLALDVGSRRLGVATSDPTGTLASPLATIQRTTPDADAAALRRLADQQGATLLLVGLPISLNGREAAAARGVRDYAAALQPHLGGLEIRFADERLSTVTAERNLSSQGVRGPRQRRVVDQVAASVFLQTWLDTHRTAAGGSTGGGAERARTRGGEMDVPG